MKRWICIFGIVALAASLPAQDKKSAADASSPTSRKASFQGLGDFPGGIFESAALRVSADGSVVVGYGTTASGKQAFCWTQAEGMVSLGNLPNGSFTASEAVGISSNGSVIVGNADPAGSALNSHKGFRWTKSGGMVDIGSLNRSTRYEPFAVSADGTVVVGDGGQQAFRWTPSGGTVGLGILPGRTNSRAVAVSANGSVVVGSSANLPNWDKEESSIWTQAGGMEGLGLLPGAAVSFPNAISPEGSAIAGTSCSPSGCNAFRWTRSTGMVSIGRLPGTDVAHPGGVSANGATIVGGSFADRDHAKAFTWDAGHGMRSLQAALESDYGLILAGWDLQHASAITPDGSVIVGRGKNPAGQQEAFRVVLAPPVNQAAVSFTESGQQINRLAGRGVAPADFNGDGCLDAFVVNVKSQDGEGHRVYFGDCHGRFTDSGQALANPSNFAGKPAVGDVNGDGKPDVITGRNVWLNDGKGHFEAHTDLIPGTEELGLVRLADLNGDGNLDLLALTGWKSVRVYLGDGKGHFRDTGQSFGQGIIGTVALGDVDGDGAIDIVTGGWRNPGDPNPNRVWLNDGKGNFRDSGQVLDQGNAHVHDIALGDVNGDGHLDIVMALVLAPDRAGAVYLNDGKGHFQNIGQTIGHQWAHGVALGDLDGDGHLDIFLACGEPHAGTPNEVWLNDGKGNFRDSGLRLAHAFSSDVALGGLTGDGRLDAIVVNLRLVDGSTNPPVFGGEPAEVWLNTSHGKSQPGRLLGKK